MNSKKVNILVVDDRPENLLALEAVLDSPDYRVVCAASGRAALRHLLAEDFAVILLGVQMPEMDGFETASLIRARDRCSHTPIIFITALHCSRENIIKGYTLGAVDYIFKPFHPETLRLKIDAFARMHFDREQIEHQQNLLKQRAIDLEKANESLMRTTQQLYRAEALASLIGELSVDTIVTIDRGGLIISINPAVYEMFGYEPDELINKNIQVLFARADSFPRYLHGPEKSKIFEEDALRRNGTLFSVEVQINGAIFGEYEQIFICSIRNITERKQMEKEREKQYKSSLEERFSKAFHANPSLMAILSLNEGRYVDVNESWLNAMEYKLHEVVGKSMQELTTWKDSELYSKIRGVLLEKGSVRSQEVIYNSKTGKEIAGLLAAEIVNIDNEPYILEVILDITEKRRFEHEMDRLDRLNLVGQMAAGIGHEIRNPMTTVRGFLQLLGKKDVFVDYKSYFDLMIEELDRANSIITEFLALAKNKVIDLKPRNLNTIVNSLYPLIQADGMVTDIDIKLDLGNIQEFLLDEKEIRQLILNLVRNGMESMSVGGTLTIKTYMDGDSVVLAVEDQGGGIGPEVRDKIGTPFFTTKDYGTGLGVATCFSIAERHGAKVEIDTCTAGTIFSVYFSHRQVLKRKTG